MGVPEGVRIVHRPRFGRGEHIRAVRVLLVFQDEKIHRMLQRRVEDTMDTSDEAVAQKEVHARGRTNVQDRAGKLTDRPKKMVSLCWRTSLGSSNFISPFRKIIHVDIILSG